MLLSACILFSCSNDDELSSDELRVLTYEEFLQLADESYENDPEFQIIKKLGVENEKTSASMRSSTIILEMEAIGYTSSKVRKGLANQKVMFTDSSISQYGLSTYTTYIIDYYEVERRVYIPKNAITAYELSSPDCGHHPGTSGRGYTSYRDGDYFAMITNLTHVKADVLGRTLNVWIPITRGELKWKYGLILDKMTINPTNPIGPIDPIIIPRE
jgi:hypothetical protein